MDQEKAESLFQEGLEFAGLHNRVALISARAEDQVPTLELTLAVQDISDWDLRYAVLQVAQQLEDDHNLSTICVFRSVEEAQLVVTP